MADQLSNLNGCAVFLYEEERAALTSILESAQKLGIEVPASFITKFVMPASTPARKWAIRALIECADTDERMARALERGIGGLLMLSDAELLTELRTRRARLSKTC